MALRTYCPYCKCRVSNVASSVEFSHNYSQYGIPFEKCRTCGKMFIRGVREPALYFTYKKSITFPISVLAIIFGILALWGIIDGIRLQDQKNLLVGIELLVFVGVLYLIINMLTAKHRCEQKNLAVKNSRERLKNAEYFKAVMAIELTPDRTKKFSEENWNVLYQHVTDSFEKDSTPDIRNVVKSMNINPFS